MGYLGNPDDFKVDLSDPDLRPHRVFVLKYFSANTLLTITAFPEFAVSPPRIASPGPAESQGFEKNPGLTGHEPAFGAGRPITPMGRSVVDCDHVALIIAPA
jgi:hypothetical protein